MNSIADLISVIEKHNLQDDVEAMQQSYKIVNAAWEKRVKLLSQRPKILPKLLLGVRLQPSTTPFKGIEVSHLLSALSEGKEDGDKTSFAPFKDELNQWLEIYYRSISIRAANNKSQAMQEEEEKRGNIKFLLSFS